MLLGWLSSGAQDQLAHVRIAAEESNRLHAQERFQEAKTDVEILEHAQQYLRTFAGNFPDESNPHYHSHYFIGTLSDLNRLARLYVSEYRLRMLLGALVGGSLQSCGA